MTVVKRLSEYLQYKNIVPYAFERQCQVANGFLKKQLQGHSRINSDIIQRLSIIYPDLNLVWLITGSGEMLQEIKQKKNEDHQFLLNEDAPPYLKRDHIKQLEERIQLLEAALADKEKIIKLLENNYRPATDS